MDIHNPIGFSALDNESLAPNRPVTLLSLTHNDAGPAQAVLRDAHTKNDQTIYLKIVFTTGEDARFDESKWVPNAQAEPGTP
jgi:hypothetical protein